MHLKILGHPVFVNLNFHMPMIVDLSHPLIMLQGENGSAEPFSDDSLTTSPALARVADPAVGDRPGDA